MGEFLDKYGGVIVGVICILALVAIVGILFKGDTSSGVGAAMQDRIEDLAAAGSSN